MKLFCLMFLLVLSLSVSLSACTAIDFESKRDNIVESTTTMPIETKDIIENTPSPEQKTEIILHGGDDIESRFALPEGFERVPVEEGSFESYLRNLPLKPHDSDVFYYNGRKKPRDVHDAVIDIDVGERDLQQCADAVMRLWAEYLFEKDQYDKIHFNFTNGFRADYSKWREGYRISVDGNDASWFRTALVSNTYEAFRNYMDMVFAYAGTISLEQELVAVPVEEMKIGDVFIQGYPGHCVIVVDMAQNTSTGEKLFMIAQSYMPAQDIHILKNSDDNSISPWYSTDFGRTLNTPEWTFYSNELKRFAEK